jgi:hypothetical protein
MPLLETGVKALSSRMPKIISPRTHAIIDYATAGSFFLMGALLWKNHKRAAISSFACGAAEATTAMITDFPGGVTGVISFPTHGKIDASLAGLVGTMPNLLAFSDEKEAIFFRTHAVAIAAVTGLTDFAASRSSGHRRRRRAA